MREISWLVDELPSMEGEDELEGKGRMKPEKNVVTLFMIAIFSGLLVTANNCTEKTSEEPINLEGIINYLNHNLKLGEAIGLLSYVFTLDSYELLGMETPNKTQIITYLNGLQSDEGTWATGQTHYVPTTAQVLMFYSRSGAEPAKSLEPFFSTVDTWAEVVNHVQIYNPGNLWGGLWGYVASYLVYKGETPPWTSEFLDAVNGNFDTWAYQNHQRTHVIGSLSLLSQPIPRIDDVVENALQQQQEDGSWDHSESETAGAVQILRLIENQSTVDKNRIDSAVDRGLEFVEKCYKTVEHEGVTYAGFAANPSEEYPNPMETAFGIWALLSPESDIWFRWYVRVYTRFERFPEKPAANEQITFNASTSYSQGGNIISYEWNFDDGNATKVTEPIIDHTYALPGTYTVTLKVIDDNSLWNTTTRTITVYFITDLNKDGKVNMLDLSTVANVFGSEPGDPNWNETADLDKNEIINIIDVTTVAVDYGKSI